MNSSNPGPDKAFIIAVLFSLITIFVGIIWTWQIGKDSNEVAHELAHHEDGLTGLRKLVAKTEAKRS